MKKFVLVVIPTRENAYHGFDEFTSISMPVGIISIAAVLEQKGYAVEVIDADAENLTSEETMDRIVGAKPDYVGSTTMTAIMNITYDFYSHLKERIPQVKVIVGGSHASALPKKTLEESRDIDFVVKGEGDETILEFLDAIERGRDLGTVQGIAFRKDGDIIETSNRPLIKELGKLPMPAYHLLKVDLYRSYLWNRWISGYRKPYASLFIGRGCYCNCNFCATKIVFGHRIRYFPIEVIKKEFDLLVSNYGIRVLYFMDDIFTANKKLVNEICDYLIEKGYNKRVEITISSRADLSDLAMLRKMRKAGIRSIFIGVESGNQKVLDIMHKNISIDQIKNAFELANKADLFIGGNYMIGALGDTYETVMDTIKLACGMKQDYTSFSIATPLPGTELYQYCIDRGIPLPPWSEFGGYNTPPIPLNDSLPADTLMKLRRYATFKFYKRPMYFLRMLRRFNAFTVIQDFVKVYRVLKKDKRY